MLSVTLGPRLGRGAYEQGEFLSQHFTEFNSESLPNVIGKAVQNTASSHGGMSAFNEEASRFR